MGKIKLEIRGSKLDDTLFTNWQISKVSNDFSEFYYKTILLNDISLLESRGIRREDILIFNSSININSKYSRYVSGMLDLNSPRDIENLFYLGSPRTLSSNKKYELLYEFFESYRVYFSVVNKYRLNVGSKRETLFLLYNKLEVILDNLESFNIYDFFYGILNQNNTIRNENFRKCSVELKNVFKSYQNNIDNVIKNTKITQVDKRFIYIFNRFERPIIAYIDQGEKIKILGDDFFVHSKFNYENKRFLETNSISQNSPLVMLLTMSPIILPYLLLILREKYNYYIANNLEGEYDSEIIYYEEEIEKLEIAIEENNLIEDYRDIPELLEPVLEKGKKIIDEYTIEKK